MDVLVVLAAWWILSLTGALAPGPLSAAVVMQASKRGKLHGIMPMVGHAFVELGIVALVVFSVTTLTLDSLTISMMQGFGGVVVILFGVLALKDWKHRPQEDQTESGRVPVARTTLAQATLQGVIVSVLSPYFLLWWFAVGLGTVSTLMVELQVGVGTVFLAATLIYFTHISTDFMFGAFLTVTAHETGKRARFGGINWLAVAIGLFQIGLGLLFIFEALT